MSVVVGKALDSNARRAGTSSDQKLWMALGLVT